MARAKQTELLLTFALPNDENSSSYIDLAQCYSLINRISARQGMQYAVAGLSVTGALDSKTTVHRLPEHWPCINAWEKGYRIWRESQDQVLDIEPSIQGRYADFKIFMDDSHQVAGMGNNLIPDTYAVTSVDPHAYDWTASEIQIPNDPVHGTTTGYHFHVIGPSTATSKGLITGYGASRSRPQRFDPNVPIVPGEDWMREAFDVGEDLEEIREDVRHENNEPPYLVGDPGGSVTFYPGGASQGSTVPEAIMFTRAGLGTQTHAAGFTVPCGLLKVIVAGAEGQGATDTLLQIRLMPGSYKGVMARPMVDVN